ncbi:MAG TPA: sigma-70 family RNA polymerase sigma factor [Micromonosporaceae bacterium]|nr:sigma-70 family RNA polymerase sigma factor [Micromonosporaceae bacterium]
MPEGRTPTVPRMRTEAEPRAVAPGRHAGKNPGDDERLLRALYDQHAEPLLMFVLRLTGGDRQAAEDVVQETLLRAWRNAHKFDADSASTLRPWLVAVARRIVIDVYRSTKARPTESYGDDLDSHPLFVLSDEAGNVVQRLMIVDALRTLTPAHRQILVESYFRGHTAQEVATQLGLPVGTVKSRLFYALRALRTVLANKGVTR